MKAKRDYYQEVTDRIIESLENGTVPWRQPWRNFGGGLSRNLKSGKAYRGINIFLLGIEAMLSGYSDPRWGTYKQIGEKGGQVRKGEKGTQIVFWKRIDPKDGEVDENGNQKKPFMLLRVYTVFNVEQADGIEPLPIEDAEYTGDEDRLDSAEALIDGYCSPNVRKIGKGDFVAGPARFNEGGDTAAYIPSLDRLLMPNIGQFDSADDYYGTAFHELVHSTGSDRRLKRGVSNGFGSEPYAKEELVAELGSAMLAAMTGVGSRTETNAAYIENWLQVLRGDRKFVVQAAAAAQKAADLILGTTFEDEPETAQEDAGSAAKADLALAS